MTICNWCGIESKSDLVCDWCKRPLALKSQRGGMPGQTQTYGTDYLKDGDEDNINVLTPRNIGIGLAALAGVAAIVWAFVASAPAPQPTPVATKIGTEGQGELTPSAEEAMRVTSSPVQTASFQGSRVATPTQTVFVPQARSLDSESGPVQSRTVTPDPIYQGVIKRAMVADTSMEELYRVSAGIKELRLVAAGAGKVRFIGKMTITNKSDNNLIELQIQGTFGKLTIPFEAFEGTRSNPVPIGTPVIKANQIVELPVVSKVFSGKPGRSPQGVIKLQAVYDGVSGRYTEELRVP